MKDIGDVRRGLGRIGALGVTAPPQDPRFPGAATLIAHESVMGFGEGANTDRVADARDPRQVFPELDHAVALDGIEALAWYHPFHLSPDRWGIYVPESSLHYIARRWFNPRMRPSRRFGLAFDALLGHEVMHHACEYAVAQYELLLAVPCWEPAWERLKIAGLKWFNDEEALSNANCIRVLQRSEAPTVVRRIHQALLQSPEGYRDFPSALSDEGFEDHRLEVLRHNMGVPAVDLKAGVLDPAFDACAHFPQTGHALASCPIYIIEDAAHCGLPSIAPRIITSIPEIQETAKFQRMLRKLDRRRQEEWEHAKADLVTNVPRHPKFEKLKGPMAGLFSIRLGDGYRAHVRPTATGVWEAVEVGSHSEMGHG